jgi:hypothetical protein
MEFNFGIGTAVAIGLFGKSKLKGGNKFIIGYDLER